MEFTSDVAIDLALTAIGYLAAGAFGVVMASIFKERSRAAAKDTEAVPESPGIATEEVRSSGRGQFIALGRKEGRKAHEMMPDAHGEGKAKAARDRTEVLKMARQMLKAGAGPDRIMQVLPVSETELGLLNYGSK